MVDIVTRLGKGSPLTNAEVDANFTNLAEVSGVTGEPMGHEDRTTSTISFNASTRTFTIAPVASSFTVWCKGKKVVVSTAQTVTIPNTTGMYSIYYDANGVLSAKSGYFTFSLEAPTAYVYWNAATGTAPYFGDERHGVVLDWQTHEYLHRTRGAALASGFSASGYVLGGNGSSNSHAQITLEGGTFFDEDMKIIVTATNTPTAGTWEQDLLSPARIPVLYLSGTAWVIDTPTDYPLKQGTARPQYNAYSGGVWSTADVANNKYSTSWILATNNLTYPVIAIIGQAQNDSQSAAEAVDFTELQLPGFPSVEFRPLYKLIFQCADSCTNAVHASLVSITDIRSIAAAGTAASIVTDHGNLSGLSDDDHPQYIHVDTLRTVSAAVKASFLPSQTSNAGKFLQTDGAATSWQALTSGNVTTALGFTPYNATNPSGYISGITSGMVTTALGFTPYNATNPSGYVTAAGARGAISVTGAGSYDSATGVINIVGGVTSFNTRTGAITLSSADVTTALGFTPYNNTNPSGYITGITSTMVTTALGFTPYNSSNPNGYISSITSANVTTALGFTPYNATNPSGYITSSALSGYLTSASAASTYLPLSGGTMTGTLGLAGTATNGFYAGTGDGASFSTYNFLLRGWNGMAFENPTSGGAYPNQVSGVVDFRNGIINMKGGFQTNGSTVLHAGNYSSYALPLSGGNMTGRIYNAAAASGLTYNAPFFVRDNEATGSNNSFSGIAFASSPGADYVIGKYSNGGTGLLQIRNHLGTGIWVMSQDGTTTHSGEQYIPILTVGGLGRSASNTIGANLGSGAISWNNAQLEIKNSDAGSVGIAFHRAGYTSNAIYANDANGLRLDGNIIVHAGNYNSYSPTLTGGGASGTWGINVTGNAGSLTATTSTGIQSSYITTINTATPGLANYGIAFSGSSAADSAQGITWGWSGTNAQAGIYVQSSGAYGTKMYFGTTDSFATGSKTSMSIDHVGTIQVPRSYLQSDYSLRAPIFYDSNNTGHYVDPASTSQFNVAVGNRFSAPNSGLVSVGDDSATYTYNDGSTRSRIYASSSYPVLTLNSTVTTGNPNHGPTLQFTFNGHDSNRQWVIGSGGTGTFLDFGTGQSSIRNPHDGIAGYGGSGSGKTLMRMTTTGVGIGGNWGSYGTVENPSYPLHVQGTGFATGDLRAPIFYDSDNTAYYINPTGNTQLNTVSLGSGSKLHLVSIGDGNHYLRYRSAGFSGVTIDGPQLAGHQGGELATNMGGDNWSLRWDSSGNIFSRSSSRSPIFYDRDNTAFYVDPNGGSNLSGSLGLGSYMDIAGALYTRNLYYILNSASNGWNTVIDRNGGNAWIVYGGDSVRAPIFYDSDNTAYYVNPASTSTLQRIESNGQDVAYSARWDIGASNWSARIVSRNYTYDVSAFLGNYNGYAGLFGHNAALTGWAPVYINAFGGTAQANVYLGNMYSPILYDLNDTGYYLDPNGTSNLNVLSDPALSDSRLYLRTKGDTNHYLWNATDDWEEMVAYSGTGFRVSNSNGTGASLTCFGSSNGNYVQAAGSMRAPIFYDSENTGYYCNPASDSNFDGLSIGTGSGGNQRIRFNAGNDSNSYSALRFSYAGSETQQIHVFGPNWQGGSFTGASAGAINLSGQNGVTFGSWPSVNAWVNTAGNFQSNGDFRAPIFYDSNNTGTYLDPNGTSNFATTVTGYMYFMSNRNTTSDSPPLQAFSSGGGGAIMSFHRGGYYAVNFGLDSDNVMRIGGWSAGANRWQLDMSGNMTVAGNVTAYSDERLKKDWSALPSNFIEQLAQVKSGTYTRIDSEERQVGVSAQGLQKFLEEAVQTDVDGMLSVNYGGAALASAVELAKEVVDLRNRVAHLESLINKLIGD